MYRNREIETEPAKGEDISHKATQTQLEHDVKKFELVLNGRAFHVNEGEAPFSRFFLGKICKTVAEHNPGSSFELEKDERRRVSAVVWHNLPEAQQKEIENTLAWSLRKIAEKKRSS